MSAPDYYCMAQILVVLKRAEDSGEPQLHRDEVVRRVQTMNLEDEQLALTVAERLKRDAGLAA